jgi:uncharacterized protein YecE (DUF72 family)
MSCEIRIGTSGWHYAHWVGRFYPTGMRAADMLAYYIQHFDTVELNNSFYHLPKESSFDAWRAAVPPTFRFAVKASRFMTHMKKLKDPAPGLENFMPRVRRLGRRLGPILFQLPPNWKRNDDRLIEFLAALPPRQRYTFELRDPTWIVPEVSAVLRRRNAAFCIYELAGFMTPLELTGDWTYIRLHGPTRNKYQGSYSEEQLRRWAERIREWAARLEKIYIYFDNDDSAYAAWNAIRLKELVSA